jgi:DNA-binding transcriptional LysR family regulator
VRPLSSAVTRNAEIPAAGRRWLGVEFRHLAALAAIAEEGSFRAAADRLGYVQSAVSQQIAALERALGARLIDRSPGSQPVALTAAGAVLREHFDDILARLGAAWADVEALEAGRAGHVRVAMTPSVEARVVPAVLPRLARATRIRVNVVQCDDEAACAALADGHVDAALVSGALPDGPLVGHRLIEDPLALLVPADAPLARRGSAPSLPEIGAIALIGRRGSSDAEVAFKELDARGIEPRIVYESDDDATIHALVGSGVGAAVVPALSVDWTDETVAALPIDGLPGPRVLTLAWHGERQLTPTLERFCDETIAACRDIQRELEARLTAPSGRVRPATAASRARAARP